MSAVSDTSTLNYAVVIGETETLHALYGCVLIPQAAHLELRHPRTPEAVRQWIADPPPWLEICSLRGTLDPGLAHLGPGEAEAIALMEEGGADLLLMDDRDGRAEAGRRGLAVTGLLGALRDAGGKGIIDLPAALDRLRKTTFRASPKLLRSLLTD